MKFTFELTKAHSYKHECVVEDHDTWNADYLLVCILVPLLKRFRKDADGGPVIDLMDIPEKFHGYCGEFGHNPRGWDWIVGEMIHGFKHALDDRPSDKTIARADNGRRLFAKYFTGLWT